MMIALPAGLRMRLLYLLKKSKTSHKEYPGSDTKLYMLRVQF